jgi:uncharacterized membrane protein
MKRIWEIDFLRGFAVLLMLAGHFIMDFQIFLGVVIIDFQSAPGSWLRQLFNLFIFTAGISSVFSRSNVKRGLKILALAVLETVLTLIFIPALVVKFGILHFFAVCMIAWPLISRINWKWLIGLGVVILAAGFYIATLPYLPAQFPYTWLFPFGFKYTGFLSYDYFPLLPYAGTFFIGAAVGKTVYANKKSIFKSGLKENFVNFLGRHSLIIYLTHQIVFGLFFLALAKIYHLPFLPY